MTPYKKTIFWGGRKKFKRNILNLIDWYIFVEKEVMFMLLNFQN